METSSVKEKILKLRKQGKTYNEIKEILNCSKGYISTICKNIKIKNSKKCIKLSDKTINEIKEFYKTHTKVETAKKFNISTTTVTKYKECKRNILTEEERIKNNYKNVKSFRKKIKEKAVEYKGGKCIVCSYDKCIRALDFHHVNPKEKEFNISQNCNKAWGKVKKELEKCVLVCCRCHREIEEGLIII